MSKKEEKWRDIESGNAGTLVSACCDHVEYNGRIIWVRPIPEKEWREMEKASFVMTIFFVVASVVLAAFL